MSLARGSKITASDFNALREKVAAEFARRSGGYGDGYYDYANLGSPTSQPAVVGEQIVEETYGYLVNDVLKLIGSNANFSGIDGYYFKSNEKSKNPNEVSKLKELATIDQALDNLGNQNDTPGTDNNNAGCRGNCTGFCTSGCMSSCKKECSNDCKSGCFSSCTATCQNA